MDYNGRQTGDTSEEDCHMATFIASIKFTRQGITNFLTPAKGPKPSRHQRRKWASRSQMFSGHWEPSTAC